MMENPWLIFAEIVIAAAIFAYLFFRPRRGQDGEIAEGVQRIEIKLSGSELKPAEIRVQVDRPAQLLIHRYDTEPDEELFEIDELQVYVLLPAVHTTIIPFNPQKRGAFPMVVAGEREAGVIIVE